jgi:microcin C transport system permease protein
MLIGALRPPLIAFAPADAARSAPLLSPINQRRVHTFAANKRAVWSLWLFLVLFILTFVSELIANDRPLMVSYKGELLFPVVVAYPETKFGGFLAETIYRDPFIADEINANGWIVWPLIRYGGATVDESLGTSAPAAPSWMLDDETRCSRYPAGVDDPGCKTIGNYHWLGTDDQGRDVVSRVLYGFRISVTFGILLTIASSIIGVIIGAVQGYFGGWIDLIGQRLLDIWGTMPTLYVLLIVSSVLVPGFWVLLFILILFSWTALVGIVRAEFLRARNLEYVAAARALGLTNWQIMFRHLFPNAMVATLTFMPFIAGGSVATLTSLDYLGLGMPPGTPSLGNLLNQGKQYLFAPWLSLTAFGVISLILLLFVFIGEGVRDAFDPRKTFAGRS